MARSRLTLDASHSDLGALIDSWELYLNSANLSPRTVPNYLLGARQLHEFLEPSGMPTAVESIRREHIEAFVVDVMERRSASTAATRYRALQQLFRWLTEEGEISTNPMARMRQPKVEDRIPQVIPDKDLVALIKSTRGQDFEDRRDHAIMLVLTDTGCRLKELIGLRVDDLKLADGEALVLGKGRRERLLSFSPTTVRAIDRYRRVRARHKDAALPWLWVGKRGRLTDSGVEQMLKRRCRVIGLDSITPHQFRHTFAHRWLADGGTETDAMRLAGWRSRSMLDRYGASAASERAREAHSRLSLVENLLG